MCEEGSWQQIRQAQENGDYKKMAALLLPLAENGDAKAQHCLGELYYYGDGVGQSKVEAIKWYQKAAVQGLAGAQCSMGFVFSHGYGVPQDKAKTRYWLERAAAQGSEKAQESLREL